MRAVAAVTLAAAVAALHLPARPDVTPPTRGSFVAHPVTSLLIAEAALAPPPAAGRGGRRPDTARPLPDDGVGVGVVRITHDVKLGDYLSSLLWHAWRVRQLVQYNLTSPSASSEQEETAERGHWLPPLPSRLLLSYDPNTPLSAAAAATLAPSVAGAIDTTDALPAATAALLRRVGHDLVEPLASGDGAASSAATATVAALMGVDPAGVVQMARPALCEATENARNSHVAALLQHAGTRCVCRPRHLVATVVWDPTFANSTGSPPSLLLPVFPAAAPTVAAALVPAPLLVAAEPVVLTLTSDSTFRCEVRRYDGTRLLSVARGEDDTASSLDALMLTETTAVVVRPGDAVFIPAGGALLCASTQTGALAADEAQMAEHFGGGGSDAAQSAVPPAPRADDHIFVAAAHACHYENTFALLPVAPPASTVNDDVGAEGANSSIAGSTGTAPSPAIAVGWFVREQRQRLATTGVPLPHSLAAVEAWELVDAAPSGMTTAAASPVDPLALALLPVPVGAVLDSVAHPTPPTYLHAHLAANRSPRTFSTGAPYLERAAALFDGEWAALRRERPLTIAQRGDVADALQTATAPLRHAIVTGATTGIRGVRALQHLAAAASAALEADSTRPALDDLARSRRSLFATAAHTLGAVYLEMALSLSELGVADHVKSPPAYALSITADGTPDVSCDAFNLFSDIFIVLTAEDGCHPVITTTPVLASAAFTSEIRHPTVTALLDAALDGLTVPVPALADVAGDAVVGNATTITAVALAWRAATLFALARQADAAAVDALFLEAHALDTLSYLYAVHAPEAVACEVARTAPAAVEALDPADLEACDALSSVVLDRAVAVAMEGVWPGSVLGALTLAGPPPFTALDAFAFRETLAGLLGKAGRLPWVLEEMGDGTVAVVGGDSAADELASALTLPSFDPARTRTRMIVTEGVEGEDGDGSPASRSAVFDNAPRLPPERCDPQASVPACDLAEAVQLAAFQRLLGWHLRTVTAPAAVRTLSHQLARLHARSEMLQMADPRIAVHMARHLSHLRWDDAHEWWRWLPLTLRTFDYRVIDNGAEKAAASTPHRDRWFFRPESQALQRNLADSLWAGRSSAIDAAAQIGPVAPVPTRPWQPTALPGDFLTADDICARPLAERLLLNASLSIHTPDYYTTGVGAANSSRSGDDAAIMAGSGSGGEAPRPARPHPLRYERLYDDPAVVAVHGFLSPEEAVHLMLLACGRVRRSTVAAAQRGVMSRIRTSSTLYFHRTETEVVRRVMERAAAVTAFPVSHMEALQVVRYQPGQEYQPHYDWFDADIETSPPCYQLETLRLGGQRAITLFVYLSESPDNGLGGTIFPYLGNLTVRPPQGTAVMWRNTMFNGTADRRTLHGGTPPTASTKYGLNIWIRQFPLTYDPVAARDARRAAQGEVAEAFSEGMAHREQQDDVSDGVGSDVDGDAATTSWSHVDPITQERVITGTDPLLAAAAEVMVGDDEAAGAGNQSDAGSTRVQVRSDGSIGAV